MTNPAADAGLSNWWPTPVHPADHFTADELVRSAELHRPVRRVRRELAVGRLALLAAAGSAVGAGPVGGRLIPTGSTARSLVGAGAVVLALRGAEVVAARRLARLEQVEAVDAGGIDGPVGGLGGRRQGLLGEALGSVLAGLVLALAGRFLLGPLIDPATGWWLAAGGAAVATAGAVGATAIRAGRAAVVEGPHRWAGLLDRAGLDREVGIGVLDRPEVGGAGDVGAPNACAVAAAGRRWILLDPGLAARSSADGGPEATAPDAAAGVEPPSVGAFIVAHEATHLARRHPEVQQVAHAATVLAALGAVPLLAGNGWPWRIVGLEPDDPASLPIAFLVALVAASVFRLPVAWVLRGLERSADAGAVELVGVPARVAMRELHLRAGGELAPPRWSRLVAPRPDPAERLEYLARCRRSLRGPDRPPPGRDPRPAPSPSGR